MEAWAAGGRPPRSHRASQPRKSSVNKRMLALPLACLSLLLAALVAALPDVLVDCASTQGPLTIVVKQDWAPIGAKRFLELVDDGYFTDLALFRCVRNFLCQFGYKDKNFNKWTDARIPDDDRSKSPSRFQRGFVSFAGNGPNSRSSHLFITLGESITSLGTEPWETPIGFVTEDSMKSTVSKWYTSYGDMPPWGKGPDPQIIEKTGHAYLQKNFPKLDYFRDCKRRTEERNEL